MKLFGLRDGNGNKVYPEMAQGMLKGYPRAVHHGSRTGTMAGDQRGTWSHVHGL